ncbi:MAG TPA: beta-galactosidase [Thermoleophilaceae bacterium]
MPRPTPKRRERGRLALALLLALTAIGAAVAIVLAEGVGKKTPTSQAFVPGYGACPAGGRPPTPGSAAARKSLFIGINSLFNRQCDLRTMTRAGIHYQRFDFDWGEIEPRPGVFEWARYDQWVGSSASAGVQVLPVLLESPSWAAPAGMALPTNPAPYADFVAHVVRRYGPGGDFWRQHPRLKKEPIRWYEIWNEPYFYQFSNNNPNPAQYARMVKATAIAGRKANPQARFLLEADTFGQKPGGDPIDWVDPMYKAVPDLNRYFDGVSEHPYSFTESPDDYTPSGVSSRAQFRRVGELRAMFVAHGAANKPFWITEIGWSTCPGGTRAFCVTASQQAQYLKRVFQIARTSYKNFVRAVFVYNYRDFPQQQPNNKEDWFGLFKANGLAKPSWNVVENASLGR